MAVKVLFFGVLTEVCNCSEDSVIANNISELKEILSQKHSKLNDYKFAIAVNQQIVKDDIALNQNDEVALLPPFSGG